MSLGSSYPATWLSRQNVVPAGEGWGLVGAGAGTTFCRDNHVAGYVFDGLRDCDDKGGNAIH